MTTYTLRKGSPDRTRSDLVVIGVGQGKSGALVACPGAEPVAAAYGRKFAPLLSSLGFTGAAGESVRLPTGKVLATPQLLVIGMGARDELTTEKVRRAAGLAARRTSNASSIALALPAVDAEHVRAVAEGFMSGLYEFREFKAGKSPAGVSEVALLSEVARRQDAVAALEGARELDRVITLARDWVNLPPNVLNPASFHERIAAAAKGTKGVKVELLDHARLEELGCGGILGVGQGSANKPCLVKLTWAPAGARGHVGLVGKGITYDSGGLTIKPGSSMTTMKSDMAGAAAVAAAVLAIARQKIPVAVTAWLPLAENSISGSAMRPGDVLSTYSGKTVEVRNTDAEGRLILADGLTMATEAEPDVIINVATLTGHMVVALGPRVAGLFGDDDTVAAVQSAAAATGEMFWPLPIPEESRTSVRTESSIADLLQHNWVRWGGGLYAAAFLEAFIGESPWAHLDIAGPAWNSGSPWGHVPAGGTGFAVPTLVEYVAALAR